jgi:ribosome biogenesis protein ENP2
MQVAEPNNIKIYSVTSASKSALPEWLARKNREHLKHDSSWRNRIELIQDFEFPEASLNLQQTPDGNYLMGTGVYQPQIRVWELSQLSCKFARHTSAENVKFEVFLQ